MYFVSVLCVTNLALRLQETNKTYLLTYLLKSVPDDCVVAVAASAQFYTEPRVQRAPKPDVTGPVVEPARTRLAADLHRAACSRPSTTRRQPVDRPPGGHAASLAATPSVCLSVCLSHTSSSKTLHLGLWLL